MELKKVVSVIGLTLFWSVWIYGLISLVIVSQYGEALRAGWAVISGAEKAAVYQPR